MICLQCGGQQKMKRLTSIWVNLTTGSGKGDHISSLYWCPICGTAHRVEDLTDKNNKERHVEKTFVPKYGLRSYAGNRMPKMCSK